MWKRAGITTICHGDSTQTRLARHGVVAVGGVLLDLGTSSQSSSSRDGLGKSVRSVSHDLFECCDSDLLERDEATRVLLECDDSILGATNA